MNGSSDKTHRAGQVVIDLCRACKSDRRHTIIAVDGEGRILRVLCDFCQSQHNYRGGPTRTTGKTSSAKTPRTGVTLPLVSERETLTTPENAPDLGEDTVELEMLLRRIIREECGLTPVVPAEKWLGGEIVFKPGREGLQEKSIPFETFFNKVVMLRNRLRSMEQQINSSDLPADQKAKLQGYITGCYGSLTSFNVLFAKDEDRFKGSGKS